VEVRAERLEDWVRATPAPAFDVATMRAVGNLEVLVPLAAQCLKLNGSLFLWLTRDQVGGLGNLECGLTWGEPLPIPLSRTGVIYRGAKTGVSSPALLLIDVGVLLNLVIKIKISDIFDTGKSVQVYAQHVENIEEFIVKIHRENTFEQLLGVIPVLIAYGKPGSRSSM
jgi:hypothetical protein